MTNYAGSGFEPRLSAPNSGVIVTGGASGIGLGCAEALAAVGRPVSLWDINIAKAEAEATRLRETYGIVAHARGVDVTDAIALQAACPATRDALGSIGGFVHSAGVFDTGSIDMMTP